MLYITVLSTSISVSLISSPFKTFSVLFSLGASVNGQLACQFSSANHLSYRIIYHIVEARSSSQELVVWIFLYYINNVYLVTRP